MPITIEQFHHPSLHLPFLSIHEGSAWCVYGGNTSGADILLEMLAGTLAGEDRDRFGLPEKIVFFTTRRQQDIFEQELARDDSDFLNFPDSGTLVREFLPAWEERLELLRTLDMECCLDTGYRQLSSGQHRKLLLLMVLASDADYLVLENPFDGLDTTSRRAVAKTLRQESLSGRTLLFFVTSRYDIPEWCSHLLLISQGEIFFQGKMQDAGRLTVLLDFLQKTEQHHTDFHFPVREKKRELIFLQDGFAGYGKKLLFSGVNLKVESGDHTLVTGRNGCGKSTLFDIITGDNSKCYSNRLRLFGRPRGSGESIWEIKNRMGIVSPALHRRHHGVGTALHVVLSGLFDSIGLYTQVAPSAKRQARKWIQWTGLQGIEHVPFRNLDYGRQRLILIARALVKEPELLMLDEPTQGLDDIYRKQLLDFLEKVAGENSTTIFYISHREDEYRPFFRQRLCLEKYLVTPESL